MEALMSLSKSLVYLKQLEQAEDSADAKRIARVVREALEDIDARLKKLEAKVKPDQVERR